MTRTNPARGTIWGAAWLFVSLCLSAQTACSEPASAPERSNVATELARVKAASPKSTSVDAVAGLHPTGAPAPAPRSSAKNTVSKVIGKRDRTLNDGSQVCDIDFVYAGRESEDLFWEEPCAVVTAKMISRRDLETMGRWKRLDGFQRKFVEAMPAGQVLYVEGRFSASVYPVDETGTSIEVAVAD